MKIERAGSVRVDLLGGTLDLSPIDLIVPEALTLNMATSLKAQVCLEKSGGGPLVIRSSDYGLQRTFTPDDFMKFEEEEDRWGPLKLPGYLLYHFHIHEGLLLTLKSASPPGAGLGGSSTLGVTLYGALCQWTGRPFDEKEAITCVRGVEAILLNSPTGHQDYYPALYGGVLALHPGLGGVKVEQLYTPELAKFIEENTTLVFSGKSRLSGISNWEVYKSFFDGDQRVRRGLAQIAQLSRQAYEAIKRGNFTHLLHLMGQEGRERKKLFSGIVTYEMDVLMDTLKGEGMKQVGMKVCGAGGGGCFLLLHDPGDTLAIERIVERREGMKKIPFSVIGPYGSVSHGRKKDP